MKPVEIFIIVPTFVWFALTLAALISLIWAMCTRGRGVASVTALCLWCALAGGTLMSSLWSTMTVENTAYQYRQIARMPPGARASDVRFEQMKALTFFVMLDRLGRRLGYFTIIIPLLAVITIVKANPSAPTSEPKRKREVVEQERCLIE